MPFYVAAPKSSIDWEIEHPGDIPIEERGEEEVTKMFGWSDSGELSSIRIAPKESPARNPAFDVTPAKFIAGFITERGILKPEEIGKLVQKN